MANPILHKSNSTAGVVPAAAALTVRELALNTADGRLFTKTGSGAVVEFARKDAIPANVAALTGAEDIQNQTLKDQFRGTNLAIGSVITSSGTLTGPAMITDGVKAISATYWNLVPDAQWIQLNLNSEKLVPEAWFYLYNLDNRRYNIAVAVSSNLTTWEWILGSGSAAGVVASYVQSRGAINGYCPVGVECPTIVPINSFCQYVRLYMNGSTGNTGNHGYEIELWSGGAPTDPYIQAVAANLVQTNDSRLTNARAASDVSAWAKAATKPTYTATEVGLGSVNNTADSAKPVSTLQQTALNLKADSSHKYHSFTSGQYFYDSYEQGNYFRLFTENARSDNIRFGAVTSPEYFDYAATNEFIAWTGAEGSIGALLDGREDTGLSVTHANRNFRFVVARNTGWPTLGMLLLQSTWTAISYPGMVVTLETSASAAGPWVVRDTATFTPANTSNNWGCHVRCTGNLHNGTGFMRITVNITDWVDSGSYTTAPLVRLCFFSNYSGASQVPWAWNYARTVNFFAVPTVNSTAVVLTNDARLTNSRVASDVFAWAKAATKPTYTATEVGAQPSGTYATGTGSASGTNTGDNAANTTYANDYRAANFVAGTNYLAPNGSAASLTGLTSAQVTTALGYTPASPTGSAAFVISASTTAASEATYVLTANLTLTLPASPSLGNRVIVANRSGTKTCVIARNGQNIMGLAENLTLDSEAPVTLLFADATRGWVLI